MPTQLPGSAVTRAATAALLGTALLSLALTPLVRGGLLRMRVLDVPNARSSHDRPVPRGGGIAIVLAMVGGWLLQADPGAWPWVPVLGITLALALVGFVDDLSPLPALPRLVAQLGSGAYLGALTLGAGTSGLGLIGAALLGAVALTAGVNVVNFMDGINGMTGLTVAAWGLVIAGAGQHFGVPQLIPMGLVLTGACLGFLPFNVPVASIFMGDVGSYALGAAAVGIGLASMGRGIPAVVVLAPAVPYIADAGGTLWRRTRAGASLTQAHREHLYQLLTAREQRSHTWVSLRYAALALALGFVAVLAPEAIAWAVSLGVAGAITYLGGRWARAEVAT